MGKASVREAEMGDSTVLAPRLRLADRREIIAHSGYSPADGLGAAVRLSERCWAVILEDEPIALFGYTSDHGNGANIWMLGSDQIQDIKWQFLRESKIWLNTLAKVFERLWAIADVRNNLHTKWYEWLGFEVTATIHQGPYDLPFYHIEYIKEKADV